MDRNFTPVSVLPRFDSRNAWTLRHCYNPARSWRLPLPINFLEQLVAEWYEYRGFFVRRNIHVGKRTAGGHEGELDVVAFHPVEKRLVQIETSMDAGSWADREKAF